MFVKNVMFQLSDTKKRNPYREQVFSDVIINLQNIWTAMEARVDKLY